MSFTDSIKTCFSKYIVFSGRASRSEFWWFFLFTFIVRLVTTWIPFVGFIIALALLLPNLAVTVRRLHDTNRTGWWMLLPIGLGLAGILAGSITAFLGLPLVGVAIAILGSVIGFLALLSFLVQPSDPGSNRYGPNPFQQPPDMGGYAYIEGSGQPYAPPQDFDYSYPPSPSSGSYVESPSSGDAPEPGGRLFCSQCGMQLQPEARFCTVCGASV